MANSKECRLLCDVNFHGVIRRSGEVIQYDKEDVNNFHVLIGHGCWLSLEKGVEAEAV